MIPRLETERLILRGTMLADFDAFAKILGDADVMRHLGGEALARNDAWRNVATNLGHWALRGYGAWCVERKVDGAVMGRVGLMNPEGWPALEVGWTLGKPYWGKGYATEAATASMAYGFATQNVDRLISLIDPENKASQNVAMRLGETKGPRHDLVIAGRSFPVDIWSISREEWQKRVNAT
jgi:RimJ/RimL family protein N-acetyltransferase